MHRADCCSPATRRPGPTSTPVMTPPIKRSALLTTTSTRHACASLLTRHPVVWSDVNAGDDTSYQPRARRLGRRPQSTRELLGVDLAKRVLSRSRKKLRGSFPCCSRRVHLQANRRSQPAACSCRHCQLQPARSCTGSFEFQSRRLTCAVVAVVPMLLLCTMPPPSSQPGSWPPLRPARAAAPPPPPAATARETVSTAL